MPRVIYSIPFIQTQSPNLCPEPFPCRPPWPLLSGWCSRSQAAAPGRAGLCREPVRTQQQQQQRGVQQQRQQQQKGLPQQQQQQLILQQAPKGPRTQGTPLEEGGP